MLRFLVHSTIPATWRHGWFITLNRDVSTWVSAWLNIVRHWLFHLDIMTSHQNIIGLFKLVENFAHDISFPIWKRIASGGSNMLNPVSKIGAQLANQPMAPFQIPQIDLVPMSKLTRHSGNMVATHQQQDDQIRFGLQFGIAHPVQHTLKYRQESHDMLAPINVGHVFDGLCGAWDGTGYGSIGG